MNSIVLKPVPLLSKVLPLALPALLLLLQALVTLLEAGDLRFLLLDLVSQPTVLGEVRPNTRIHATIPKATGFVQYPQKNSPFTRPVTR